MQSRHNLGKRLKTVRPGEIKEELESRCVHTIKEVLLLTSLSKYKERKKGEAHTLP
jgi:hypothetical protein